MKYSIIITCYNKSKFVSRCIRSAINQRGINRSSYEIIVVDDKSKDKSLKIINEFEGLIKIIKNRKNLGLPNSRNIGIKKSKGKYILLLDADDYLNDFFLSITGSFLDFNQSWNAAATDYFTVRPDGKKIKRYSCKDNPIACGILYRRKIFSKIGNFDENFKILEDQEFRSRFLKKFKFGFIELPLYRYTMHNNNMTKNKKAMMFYRKKLLKKLSV